MLRTGLKPFEASFAPRIPSRAKGYIPPGGRTVVPRRIPRKLRTGDVRPAVYYKFDQTVQLSDGSTFTRRSPFPRLEWKYLNDQRNSPIWNPSKPDSRALELDASGRLAKFKKRFGEEFGTETKGSDSQDDAFDLDDLLSTDAKIMTEGKLHQNQQKKKKK